MKIYNSLTNKLEEFKSIEDKKVSMYVCGPTVYNYVHIGNMRPVIFFDVVYRYFKYLGYEVKYISNFTDINPKITQEAKETRKTEREIAKEFTEAYLEDVNSLNCLDVSGRPTVLNNLDSIIKFIEELVKKEYAYEIKGNVYFRINKVEKYGFLSNQKIEDLKSGARIEINEEKENPLDFALWRKTEEGENFNSPWGRGIPGWHTECVVMIDNMFDGKIDIHGGGVDLKFPHHENEIAQSIAVSNHKIANYWMHNGYINIDGEKMSKSIGNILWAKDITKEYGSNVVRLTLLKTHYRQPINITEESFEESRKILEKITNVLKNANIVLGEPSYKREEKLSGNFINAIEDDFNTSNAITAILDEVKTLNSNIKSKKIDEVKKGMSLILNGLDILGIKIDLIKITGEILEELEKWKQYRENKEWEQADKIRKSLIDKKVL